MSSFSCSGIMPFMERALLGGVSAGGPVTAEIPTSHAHTFSATYTHPTPHTIPDTCHPNTCHLHTCHTHAIHTPTCHPHATPYMPHTTHMPPAHMQPTHSCHLHMYATYTRMPPTHMPPIHACQSLASPPSQKGLSPFRSLSHAESGRGQPARRC